MTTSRRGTAFLVAPTVVAGMLAVPVLAWTQLGGEPTVRGGAPEPQAFALSAYVARQGDPAQDPRLDDALAPDGTPVTEHDEDLETVIDSPVVQTDEFRIAGVTWEQGTVDGEVVAYVRTRSDDGWGAWYEMHEAVDGPDPDSAEAQNARAGTDPMIVVESDAVQVVVATADGEVPDDIQVDVVGLGEDVPSGQSDAPVEETDLEPAAAVAPAAVSAAAGAARPRIRSRAQWGANEGLRSRSAPEYGRVDGAVVHHTAGSNAYTKAEVPQLIRGIYSYHVKSRGWRDIGYNVLVDKWGRAWEGRWGGLTRNVVGAHALNNNSTTFGISVLGNFDSAATSNAVVSTISKVIAWKFSLNRVNPRGTRVYTTNTGGKVRKQKVVGHRDVGQTACPGRTLYNKMGSIRNRVVSLMGGSAITPRVTVSPTAQDYLVGGSLARVTVKVTASGAVPSGTVKVVDADSGAAVSASRSLVEGEARVPLARRLPGGTRRLRVHYSGDPVVSWATSSLFTVTVTKATTTTTASLNRSSMTSGDLVRADVRVGRAGMYPEGKVSVYSGSTRIGGGTLSRVDGTAWASASVRLERALVAGTHRVRAVYHGNGSFRASRSGGSTLRVAKGRSRITAVSLPRVPRYRARAVLKIRAVGPHQRASGRVVVRENDRLVGSGTMRWGKATVRLNRSTTRTRALTVRYLGSGRLHGSPTVRQGFRVRPARIRLRTSFNDRSVRRGQRVVLRVRASASGFASVRGDVRVVERDSGVMRRLPLRARQDGSLAIPISTSRPGTYRIRVRLDPRGYAQVARSRWMTLRVR